MDIKSKVFKRRSGKSKDKWMVRIEYFDHLTGKNRSMERHTDKRSEAIETRNRLIDEVKTSHGQSQTGERMTFSDLVTICKKSFYKPATIVDGRKIAGVRSYETVRLQLESLNAFFGKQLLRQITKESLESYKLWRLKKGEEKLKRSLKISTINRELSTMRRMMRFAYSEGWILKDIFFNAKVIDVSAEMERSRLLTPGEEIRLLEACQGKREVVYERILRGKKENITATHDVDNPHLKAILLLAIDSGLRKGEILKLRWQDFDFENNLIRILGTHTKTERERLAPLSKRAIDELKRIKRFSFDEKPFPFLNFKRSFATAKRLAAIENLQFRDLRRTAITKWQQQEIPLGVAGKLAGHTQLQTTMKHYTSTDAQMVREVANKINLFHAQEELAISNDMVN